MDDTVMQAEEPYEEPEEVPEQRFLHGFRIGWGYVAGMEEELASPHLFVVGYELTHRLVGGDWLNVIVVENAMVAGVNQSVFLPSANGLLGFEVAERAQVGAGVNVTPFDPGGKPLHMIAAAGYTPKAGVFYVPVHAYWIPDVDGQYRFGLTTGVNW